MTPEYLGVSKDALQLILQAGLLAIQAIGLGFLLLGAMRALHELRAANASASHRTLETMLKEWRSEDAVDARDRVLESMPLVVADAVEEKVGQFASFCAAAEDADGLDDTLAAARKTVHFLNDLGAYVENGVISQRLFLGHFHVRLIELTTLLEPYVLYVTGQRGTRWGIRLLRLKAMALAYHEAERKHRPLTIRLRGTPIHVPRTRSSIRVKLYWRKSCRSGVFGRKEVGALDLDDIVSRAIKAFAEQPGGVRGTS